MNKCSNAEIPNLIYEEDFKQKNVFHGKNDNPIKSWSLRINYNFVGSYIASKNNYSHFIK